MIFHRGETISSVKGVISLLVFALVANVVFGMFNQVLASSRDGESLELQYRSVRAMGMGNAFAAIADDGDAFYFNPAGLTAATRFRIDFEPIRVIPTLQLYGESKDVQQLIDDIKAITESSQPLEDPDLKDERIRLMQKMEDLVSDNLGLETGSPLRFVLPIHIGRYGVALGGMAHAWSESQIQILRRGLDWNNFTEDILDDGIFYNITAEASYGGAGAVQVPLEPLPLDMSFGILAKRIYHWKLRDSNALLGIQDIVNPNGEDGIPGTADDFSNRYFDPADPFASLVESKGYSIDLGSIISAGETFNAAAIIKNAAGKMGDEVLQQRFLVSRTVNLAKLTTPDIPMLDIILAASSEINDGTWVWDKDKHKLVDMVQLGAEVMWTLPLLSISARIGSNRGYPTLGAGVQFLFLDMDYAFYQDEEASWHAFSLNMSF